MSNFATKPWEWVVSRFAPPPPPPTNKVSDTLSALRERLEDQLPLTQAQIERLAKVISDRVIDVSTQAQQTLMKTARKADRRVWWLAGITVGFGVAAATTFTILRRRARMEEVMEESFTLSQDHANGQTPAEERLQNAVTRAIHRENGPDAVTTATVTGVPAGVHFVGNVRTMIFHDASSEHLPAEEHRIYFRSEEDARAAGYRPALGE
jgi:predicted PurR-regulated permease PerM